MRLARLGWRPGMVPSHSTAAALTAQPPLSSLLRTQRQMGEHRYDALVVELARVIKLAFTAGATGSLWGLEGPLRAGIRSDLCLQGWGWRAADLAAREVLEGAFRGAGALVRPTWNEGQPEWTIESGTLIERTRCASYHKPLPDGHTKFCSRICSTAYNRRLSDKRHATEEQAIHMAVWLD